MLKLSKGVLYTGIAVVIISQLQRHFARDYFNSSITTVIISGISSIVYFGFELLLLRTILKQIQKNNSFGVLFILLFITQTVGILSSILLNNYGTDFYYNNKVLLFMVPNGLAIVLSLVVGIKYFLLQGNLAIWFKIYASLLFILIINNALGNYIFDLFSYGSELQLNVNSGLGLALSATLCMIFYQTLQELDDQNVSEDFLDLL